MRFSIIRPSALLAVLLALPIAGCGDKPSPGAAETPAAEAHAAEKAPAEAHAAEKAPAEAHAAEKHAAAEPGDGMALALDNGQKWKMDDHTRVALAGMDARLKKGPATDDAAGYKALGVALDGDIQSLVRGCKMTGPSHDQLHVWLTGVIPAIGALSTVETPADGKSKHDAIGALMAAAHRTFE